jgi:adenine deaminase
MQDFTIKAQLVNIEKKEISSVEMEVTQGSIRSFRMIEEDTNLPFLLPGFIDSHVHIESSMLIPSEFAKLAVVHGTVATISDPHEIGNVCGVEGVKYMINNGKTVPFKFHFGAPSCVPATKSETAGAEIGIAEVKELLQDPAIYYLSEMMNFPGVLNKDPEVMAKIKAAHALGKPVDGHAPGLRGEAAKQYINAGISTDHECFTLEEALEKLQHGMKILIREGSAAKNFDALIPLLNTYSDHIMFCSDDKHPDSLVDGHINQLCQRAIDKGIPLFNILQAACINPVKHYKMDVGLLNIGDPADFILVKDLHTFDVLSTYINGKKVAENGKSHLSTTPPTQLLNQFTDPHFSIEDLAVPFNGQEQIPVIGALDGQLITEKLTFKPTLSGNNIISNTEEDVLKIVVVNRYQNTPVAKAFIHRFGFKSGAIASTVAHDSHNIIAVGVDDESIYKAIQSLIQLKGGISCVNDGIIKTLGLPVAGLMSADDGYQVAKQYTAIDEMAKTLGTSLSAPFMTLSFMALLVIPHLKLSDRSLFDGDQFKLITF